jgi:hypothetical protein
MTNINSLRAKATELGFSFKKGAGKFAGYVLTNERHDDLNEKPLGSDFSASLSDIADFLETFASDINAGRVKESDEPDAEPEVEISATVATVKPPSPQKLAASLRGHESADEIKAMTKAPKQTKQDVHTREALDYLLWVVNDPRASGAFYRQSKALQDAHWETLRLALEADEKAKAAKLPKSTVTIQDLDREERARQARKFHKINEKFRTNLDSIRDPMSEDDRDFELDLFRDPEKDRAAWLQSIEREDAAFLAPEAGPDYAAPTPSTGFARVSIGRRR